MQMAELSTCWETRLAAHLWVCLCLVFALKARWKVNSGLTLLRTLPSHHTQTHTFAPGAVLWLSEALVLVFPRTYYLVENTKSVYTHASGHLNITVCNVNKGEWLSVCFRVCVRVCVGISRLNHDSSLLRLRVCRRVFYLVTMIRAKVTPPPPNHYPLFTCLSHTHEPLHKVPHMHISPCWDYLRFH